MLKIIFSTLLITSTSLWAASQNWSFTSEYKTLGKSKVSHLTWKKGQQVQKYIPEDLPFGMTQSKKFLLSGQAVWVTSWAANSNKVTYRVFQPSRKNTPICEMDSFSDKTRLRIKRGTLQIKIIEDETLTQKSSKQIWVDCQKAFSKK